MKHCCLLCIIYFIIFCGFTHGSESSTKVLADVPAYNWYHGCGPTAAASVIGYHDLNGFDNLFTASGWDEVRLTENVQDQISSPQHNAKYDPTPDNYSLPIPAYTSIADWFQTSVDPIDYGWSYITYADDAFEGYINYSGYHCRSWFENDIKFTWADLVNEIDTGRPMMFLVDTNGDDESDHFVPVFGYDDRGDNGKYYGCYTTWSESETISWREFQRMNTGVSWGVSHGIFVEIYPYMPGDFNIDSVVDVLDLGILATNYRTTSGMDWEDGDADGDGAVDASDLGVLATNYGNSDTFAQVVPEPAGLSQIMITAPMLCLLRRKRP